MAVFWLNTFAVAGQGILQFIFSARFTKKKVKLCHIMSYIVLFFVFEIFDASVDISGIYILFNIIFIYVFNRAVFRNNRLASFTTSVLATHVSQISFGIVEALSSLVFPKAFGNHLAMFALIAAGTCASLALCIFVYSSLLKNFSLFDGFEKIYGSILLPCIFFLAAEQYIIETAYGNVVVAPQAIEPVKHISLTMAQIAGLAAFFAILLSCRRAYEGIVYREEAISLTQKMNAQRVYISQVKKRYELTKSFRHDIKNHVLVLNALLERGKIDQAENYLKAVGTYAAELSLPCQTGNDAIDILLWDKIKAAENSGVKTDVFVCFPEEMAICDFDLCVIFSNAVDNAVHACDEISGPKFMSIKGERQGNFYMLKFENSCSEGSSFKAKTGIRNIKNVTEKYNGAMTAEKGNGVFSLCVLIDISVH
ncbi:MAG: GHKL domain-containing protein [Firmicutes bacterium]|nr:GHKL domain-containing protein [Bacillota bacterium]